MPRTPIVGGNWKMNETRAEARALLHDLREELADSTGVEVVVFPPAPWLGDACDAFAGTSIGVGAQNVYWGHTGAFTGEFSPDLLVGTAAYALLGHSERRQLFGELDDQVNARLRAVLEAGLTPVLAIGETREQREAGATLEVLARQFEGAFDGFAALPPVAVLAYEPVWAIGTGLTATPDIAQETCAAIRSMVERRFDRTAANALRIQYGGSVTAENAAGLAAQPDIDGALVGGASLDASAFVTICRAFAASV
jgi:triosephosphate isomerase